MSKKEIKLKTLEDTFNSDEIKILSNEEIIQLFCETFHPITEINQSYQGFLYKIGRCTKPTNIGISLYPDIRGGNHSVCKIDIPNFAQETLREIEKYRILGSDIYKTTSVPLKEPGAYIITKDEIPKFKIEISPTRWIAGEITIEEYRGNCSFQYSPDFESQQKQVKIKTLVPQRAEKDSQLIKKLFTNFHNKLKETYQPEIHKQKSV